MSTPAAPLFAATYFQAAFNVQGLYTLSIRLYHFPPFTPLPRAANIRSVHTDASTHSHRTGLQASAPCLATSGTVGAGSKLSLICTGIDVTHPTFLPPFPRPGFASQDSRLFNPRYYEGSESCNPSPGLAGLPTYFAPPSSRSASNHMMPPTIVLTATST